MDIKTFFSTAEIDAVSVCFGPALPSPVVERVLELRIMRIEKRDDEHRLRCLEFYKDGKLHGKCEGWYKNGHKKYTLNLRNGSRYGKCEWFYENGQKWYEGIYRNNKRVGKWNVWYRSGQKRYEVHYQNGKLVRTVRWKSTQARWTSILMMADKWIL